MRTEIIEILQKAYPQYCLKHIDTANEILRLFEENNAANEWISVDDEPKKEMWIIAKTEYPKTLPFYKSMFYVLENKEQLKLNFTHWKPIN